MRFDIFDSLFTFIYRTMKQFTILLLAIILLSTTIAPTIEAAPSRQLRYINGPAASANEVARTKCDCPGVYCGPGCKCCVA
jgi:hypothetical protein